MLLSCPDCETIFRVDSADMPAAGRKVRCTVCRHVWNARPGGAAGGAHPAARRRMILPMLLAGALIITVMAGLVLNRNMITANLPVLMPLYENLGLKIAPQIQYLDIGRLNGLRQRDTVRLTGELVNTAIWAVHAPKLEVTVTDPSGLVLAEKTITLVSPVIAGKQTVVFTAQMQLEQELKPDQVTDIIVRPLAELSHE